LLITLVVSFFFYFVNYFAAPLEMICAFEEAGIVNINQIRDDIPSLLSEHNRTQHEISTEAKNLIYSGNYTRKTFDTTRSLIKQTGYTLPTYKTISTSFSKMELIPWNEDPSVVLKKLISGEKAIISLLEYGSNRYFHISLSNRCIWIMYLTIPLLKKLYNPLNSYKLSLTGFFWYDGGKISRSYSGLASGLKVAAVSLQNLSGEIVVLPKYIKRKIISYCWILNCRVMKENSDNVKELESMLLEQYNYLKNCNIVHNGYSLEVSIIGCAADHGVRSKLLCRDDNSEGRCGECSYLFIKNTPYRFLNWECLMKCVPVNSRNFKSFRTTILTALLKNSSELSELGLMSYDNLHNCVGHLKEIISLLISIVSKGDKKEVAEKVSLYTGIRTSTLLHANDCFFLF